MAKKRKSFEIIGWDPAGRRAALDNGWSYAESDLVGAAVDLTASAPYAMEVIAEGDHLVVVPDPADERPAGLDKLRPIHDDIKPSKTGDPTKDRRRAL